MSKIVELAAVLSTALEESDLDRDGKIKAIALARGTLDKRSTDLDAWRRQRVSQGIVGSGKKAQAMREDLVKQKGKRR